MKNNKKKSNKFNKKIIKLISHKLLNKIKKVEVKSFKKNRNKMDSIHQENRYLVFILIRTIFNNSNHNNKKNNNYNHRKI